ncbi:unnamed protein product [Lactuca saligna]|uniref:Uncharacterized protein n=1 Tax=Lactuca saligna TaxID=75948 RepID=A0AA35V245_LACSI|nr:unnamed protein product [Lactuca saligna]
MAFRVTMFMNMQFLLMLFVLSLLVIFIDGSNDGKSTFEVAMMKTDSGKLIPPPSTLESHNQFNDNKLRGVCIPSPSSTCRDTKAAETPCSRWGKQGGGGDGDMESSAVNEEGHKEGQGSTWRPQNGSNNDGFAEVGG